MKLKEGGKIGVREIEDIQKRVNLLLETIVKAEEIADELNKDYDCCDTTTLGIQAFLCTTLSLPGLSKDQRKVLLQGMGFLLEKVDEITNKETYPEEIKNNWKLN